LPAGIGGVHYYSLRFLEQSSRGDVPVNAARWRLTQTPYKLMRRDNYRFWSLGRRQDNCR